MGADKKITLAGGSVGGPPRKYQKTYFIYNEEAGTVKIGRGVDPIRRLANLQTGSTSKLKLLAVINEDCEAILHRRFAHLRTTGEWFEASPSLMAFIRDIGSGHQD